MAAGTPKSTWQVAFHPLTGDHMDYDANGTVRNPEFNWAEQSADVPSSLAVVYKPATHTFEGVLKFEDYDKGRSRVSFYFRDKRTGVRYVMQLAELVRNIPNFHAGQLGGRFGFVKNGTSTGIVKL